MADLADVETAIITLIGTALYPNGLNFPSITAFPVRFYRGWPNSAALDTDLKNGTAHVSVYSQPGVERNTTRYLQEWLTSIGPVHTLTATVTRNTITIGGTVSTPQNVSVLIGFNSVSYAVLPGDTLSTIATAVAALINAIVTASAAGAVITVSSGVALVARIGATGTLWKELGRQLRGFQITSWCSTPAQRDALAAAVDIAMRQVNFLTLADNSAGRLRYESSHSSDATEKEILFRRDLFYSVEYPATLTMPATEITIEKQNIDGGQSPADATIVSISD
jgi:hypothetical protein